MAPTKSRARTIGRSILFLCLSAAAQAWVDLDLFVGGTGGYACYRLPNLVQLQQPGHLLAVVQGHKFDCSDGGAMDVLARRSSDNGHTWSAPQVVYTETTDTRNVTIGTPTAVVDMAGGGTVFLFVCPSFTRILLLTSKNGGESWSKPRDLTSALFPSGWHTTFFGLPQGIQLSSGRLIVCANRQTKAGASNSYTVFSDDHGCSWRNGSPVAPTHMGECSLAQAPVMPTVAEDGLAAPLLGSVAAPVVMYARVWWDDNSNRSTRGLAVSLNGGETFSKGNVSAFPRNPGADSQGAIVAVRGYFLVGSPWGEQHFPRRNYTVLRSEVGAEGAPHAWAPMPGADPLWAGPAGYSTILHPLADPETVMVLYERGVRDSNEGLHLTQLPISVV